MNEIVKAAKGRLSWIEAFQIRTVRRTFEPGVLHGSIRWLQRNVGARWMPWAVSRISHFHHLERLPKLPPETSYVLVCNHRSTFDMFLVISELVRRGIVRQRIVFPVKSEFFYDHPLGMLVNGMCSFFAMYPPIFRSRERASINVSGLDEMVTLLKGGGTLLGIHPEGTRNRGNPYELLPFRSGVGRIIHGSHATVIPVFTNGLLLKGVVRQVVGNFLGNVETIHTVFGTPIDFGDLLDQPRSPKVFQAIADKTYEAIGDLAREERELRVSFEEAALAPAS